jgi:pimeloyl-ACP methyl ester carboxylesterase
MIEPAERSPEPAPNGKVGVTQMRVETGVPAASVQTLQERWVDCAGVWIHTADWSPAVLDPAAAPVLLVHGLGGCTVNWELVGQLLADELGAPVTALDLPGFGRTRADTRAPLFPLFLDLLAQFLESRGPAMVMGNSMGGSLGLALAANHPDLVSGLVLVNAALPRPRGNFDDLARTMKFAALMAPRAATPIVRARARRLGHEGLVDATLAIAMEFPQRLDPQIRARMISLAAERHGFPETAASYTLAGGSLFRYLAGPVNRDIGEVRCPTLILHGRRDRLVSVGFARGLAAKRKDWTYVELAGCGHVPQMEQPERFAEVVSDWANRLPSH